jgi:hypothetical protein
VGVLHCDSLDSSDVLVRVGACGTRIPLVHDAGLALPKKREPNRIVQQLLDWVVVAGLSAVRSPNCRSRYHRSTYRCPQPSLSLSLSVHRM